MEQNTGITEEEEKVLENEIKANGKWQDEEESLQRLDELYKFLVSTSPGELVQQFNQLYLLAQRIFQDNLALKKKVNKITVMYLHSEIKRSAFNNPMISDFRKQF